MRKQLAAQQHEIWSHWMNYMFTQGVLNADGTWTMPAEKVERWKRQMDTPFDQLTEKEQVSDYSQADKIISVLIDDDALLTVDNNDCASVIMTCTRNGSTFDLSDDKGRTIYIAHYSKADGMFYLMNIGSDSQVFESGLEMAHYMLSIAEAEDWIERIPTNAS